MREPSDELLPAPGVGRGVRGGRRHPVHRRHLLHARDAHLPARVEHLDGRMGELIKAEKNCTKPKKSRYMLQMVVPLSLNQD